MAKPTILTEWDQAKGKVVARIEDLDLAGGSSEVVIHFEDDSCMVIGVELGYDGETYVVLKEDPPDTGP